MKPGRILFALALAACFVSNSIAADFDTALRWRNVGPYRGGRTRAVCGVPSQPNVFYMAPVNGGVFKTTDAGRTWQPIFDDQPTGSIGAIAVAPSNPDIIYVGSGEGLHRPDLSIGDGIYKTTDGGIFRAAAGGKTWNRLSKGLPTDVVQANLAIAASAPKTLFATVASLSESKLFRSDDAGENWTVATEEALPARGIGGGDLPVV